MKKHGCLTLSLLFGLAACSPGQPDDPDNLWLDESYSEPALEWVADQNAETLKELEHDPRFQQYRREAEAVLTEPGRLPFASASGGFVYDYWQDKAHIYGQWRRMPYTDYAAGGNAWEILLDLDALSADENTPWIFSGGNCRGGDSSRCMVQLSRNGMDASVYREYDLAAGGFVEDGFSLPEAKSSVWWLDDDTLLAAVDSGRGSLTAAGYPQAIKRWRRGQPLSAAETVFEVPADHVFTFAAFINAPQAGGFIAIDGADYLHHLYWLVSPDGTKTPLPLPARAGIQGVYQGALMLRLNDNWTPGVSGRVYEAGSLVKLSLQGLLQRQAVEELETVYVPGQREAIRQVQVIGDTIYLNLLRDLRSTVIGLSPSGGGWREKMVPLGDDLFIEFMVREPGSDRVLIKTQNPLTPEALFAVDLATGETMLLHQMPPLFDASDLAMEIIPATSRDGAEIFYTAIHHKDQPRDGTAPALVYGYGGFDVSVTPRYEPIFGKLWLEKGGAYIHAYLRGGGEFGPRWHNSALLDKRQLAYDDMIAVLEDVHHRGISNPKRTGIMGRSNGGLMVAAVMMQRPDLMNAAVVGGPLIDMLRFHKPELVPGLSWAGEYGNPDDPDTYAYISRYSPLQNLRKDAAYPTPLIITSTYDDRVLPGHARRFAARMQALDHDALYFEDRQGGHYWELAGGPPPGDWRKRALARTVEYIYLARRLKND